MDADGQNLQAAGLTSAFKMDSEIDSPHQAMESAK